MIRVRIADAESRRVALWERHREHPGGEVFLAGPGEFEVASTPAVESRLRDGFLVLVEPAIAPPPEKATGAAADPHEAKKSAAPAPDEEGEPVPSRDDNDKPATTARPKKGGSTRGRGRA